MKKIVYLFILLLIIVPVYAQTSISTKVEFSMKYYPDSQKINFNPNYYLYCNFKDLNISAFIDMRDSGFKGGYLSLTNIGNILDIYFAKYYISVEGTKALWDSLLYNRLNLNGIQITLKTPVKLTLTYLPSLIESDVAFNTGRLVLKAQTDVLSKFLGLNLYGLYDMNMQMTVNTFLVGAEVKPLSFLSLFFEYGNNSRNWAVGGTIKPVNNITLSGYYRGDGGYNVEASISDIIPKLSLYGAYYSAPDSPNYVYGRIVLPPLPFGNIDALFGQYTSLSTSYVWYVRLSSSWGKVSNTLRFYKGWSFGAGWFDTTIPTTLEEVVSVSF
ncbi:MAG: hypothetical protein ACPLVD_05365 [Dictyoglomus turgidum]|uniref:DUF5723 domain-containing protein n=1 Tax=Dictyoglomus turgidum (strain DSM 6724 / Z-1310) TaxID=515635 RepID=B8E1V3_DICTD|nr:MULTISPECIES: hypothetical protein [Dictyoglomus]ACK41736.1 hypothetical protein Dtur_0434 [Dictyoglomus turgidum DSM 6724]HBU31767.1 hypothetical protein [Dictyoglomus sp.]